MTIIIRNTERNHYEKYEQDKTKKQVLCHVAFIDIWSNEIKNFSISDYCIIYRIIRRIRASKKRYSVNKVNKLMITTEAEMRKNVINTYLKMKIPMSWRRFFLNIANNTQYRNNYCNTPYKKLHRYCQEWYFYNLMKNITIGI